MRVNRIPSRMSASMNSEERHRLKTNELGQVVQAVGHRLEDHVGKIVGAICGILLVAAVIVVWSRNSNASAAKAWTLLENAQSVDDYGKIREDYKGTLPGRWASLRESELYLQTGMSLMFENRELALTDLKKAKDGFELLASEKSADPSIQERALWGLALVLESTGDGDTTKAVECYERLLSEVPETYYKGLAEQRIAALKTGGAKEFYAWFSKQNPKPAESRPKDGLKDDFDMMLPTPGRSEFDPPSSEGGKSTKGTRKTEDPAPDVPATVPESKKPEGKPDDAPAAKEGDAKPEEKPTTEKSPEPKPEKPEKAEEKKEDKKE